MSEQITPNPSVPSQVVAEVKFPKFISNLGIIPTSYKDSMSYYECLTWLCKFLEETVIPSVNENGEAVEELQALYIELNSYITNYFDNLNVQDEINNKLDEMVTDGTLDEIINQNIFSELNDDITQLQSNLTTTQQNLESLIYSQTELENMPTLFIGDSYCVGDNNYAILYKNYFSLTPGTTYFKYALGGAGFVATGTGGKTFANLLSDAITEMTTTQKESIKLIIVGSCVNDANYQSSSSAIKSAVSTFMGLVESNFPNAKTVIAPFGYRITTDGNSTRTYLANVTIPSIMNTETEYRQPVVITNAYTWLHNSNYFQEDNLHPNSLGQRVITNKLIRALQGQTDYILPQDNITITLADSSDPHQTFQINTQMITDKISFRLTNNTRLYYPTSYTPNTFFKIGTWSAKTIQPMNNNVCDLPIVVRVYMNSSTDNYFNGLLRFQPNGDCYMCIWSKDSYSDIVNLTINQFQSFKQVINL